MPLGSFVLLLVRSGGTALSQTVKEYQQQASELARSYRFPEAVQLLQTGLRQHPGNLELARQLGVLLVRTGNATEGERLLREALARQPHQLELLDALAEAELRQGRPVRLFLCLRMSCGTGLRMPKSSTVSLMHFSSAVSFSARLSPLAVLWN